MVREKILVVDDEEDILELIRFNLRQEGFEVTCADSGERALEILKSNSVDLMVLDLMLPGIDGLAITKHLKSSPIYNHIPIVMLTAKDKESDVVAGLEVGAEDYITKPFSPSILAARVRAVLRRQATADPDEGSVLHHEELTIDMRKHVVMVQDQPVSITYTEFEVLALLASRPGWVFSRSQIVDAVRGTNYSVTDRSVDVHIVGLRRKLGKCSHYIQTVRGVGYRFRDSKSNQ
jgi:two-component system phosphate regulon response regulator PhoB